MRGAGGPSPPRMQMRRQRAPRRSIAATMRCQTHDALVVGKVRMNANDWTAILEPEPSMATRTAFHNRSAHVLRRSRDLPRRTKRAEEQSQTPWQALAELKEAMQSALPRPARMWHRPARGSHYLHLRASAARRNTIPSPACVQAAHAKPRQKCSKPSSQSASQSVGARAGSRGLTLRSSGAPTACHQGPPAGTVYIFCWRALASYRRRPLSSNVRHHKAHSSMYLDISTFLDCSPEQAAANAKTPRLLEFVASPLVEFKPVSPSTFPEFWTEGTHWVSMRILGFLPFGTQAIVISYPPSAEGFLLRGQVSAFAEHFFDVMVSESQR